jgi:hypothetical protein
MRGGEVVEPARVEPLEHPLADDLPRGAQERAEHRRPDRRFVRLLT